MRRWAAVALAVAVSLAWGGIAYADLVYTPGIVQLSGTGLGSVNTLVTVHDPGGTGNQNGTESGCITSTGAFSPCAGTVQGGDNTAINQTFTLSQVLAAGQDAGDLVVVVNLAETGQDKSATLTDLYLTLTNGGGSLTFSYTGPDLVLTQGGSEGTGTGNSGFEFSLNLAQSNAAAAFCLNFDCIISGGVQFANGTTDDGNETIHIISLTGPTCDPNCGPPPNQVSGPASLILVGSGLLASIIGSRRRKS
jgi:hypothetical protein